MHANDPAVRRALELGTSAVQELQAKQAGLIQQAVAAERLRWEETSRTLAQRFEKAASEERMLALKEADDSARWRTEALLAQAAVSQAEAVEAAVAATEARLQRQANEQSQELHDRIEELERELASLRSAGGAEASQLVGSGTQSLAEAPGPADLRQQLQMAQRAQQEAEARAEELASLRASEAIRATVAECQAATQQLLIESRTSSEEREHAAVAAAVAEAEARLLGQISTSAINTVAASATRLSHGDPDPLHSSTFQTSLSNDWEEGPGHRHAATERLQNATAAAADAVRDLAMDGQHRHERRSAAGLTQIGSSVHEDHNAIAGLATCARTSTPGTDACEGGGDAAAACPLHGETSNGVPTSMMDASNRKRAHAARTMEVNLDILD